MVSFMHSRTSHDNKKIKAVTTAVVVVPNVVNQQQPSVLTLCGFEGKPSPNGSVTIMTSATKSKLSSLNRLKDERV